MAENVTCLDVTATPDACAHGEGTGGWAVEAAPRPSLRPTGVTLCQLVVVLAFVRS